MSSSASVDALAARFWAGIKELSPLWATMLGDERGADRLDDPSSVGRAAEAALVASVLAEADTIDETDLGVEDRITLDLVRLVARTRKRGQELALWQFEAVDQMAGPQTLPADLARLQRVDSPERVDALLARLAAYPAYIDAHIANLEAGRDAGRTAAPQAFSRTITQVRLALSGDPEAAPLLVAHPELADADKERIREALDESVNPALERFVNALEAIAPSARPGDGICWLPDGDEVYRYLILSYTGLEDDPRTIHEFGLARITAIREEMTAIAHELGQPDVASLRAFLATDPENHVTDPADMVALATDQIARTTAVAPQWFGRLPVSPVEVRAVEPHQERDAPPAFYIQAAPDGSRPGIYFLNTFDPSQRPLHRLASTTFHEAVPGHHFQIALEAEHPGLPEFRRFAARLASGAFVEGWGLYSERLADEMGLYRDARERFGMLEAQAWRAARLVVDTGLHAFRWTREQSIALLQDAAGLSPLEAQTETDRYITWPGQALCYMIGQREIEGLRTRLEARDGDRFDLRAFHDAVIGHGSLPLSVLRDRLPEWVGPREPQPA
jgi:uncharacterized protein (DUF885 family)